MLKSQMTGTYPYTSECRHISRNRQADRIFHYATYSRLSKEDLNKGASLESLSIENQKMILSGYGEERGWNLVEEYVDDGYSGANFQRPDFQRMLRDIESGKIDCVIVKDLSRLGRNFSMTGYYTDEYFPQMGVRFIAVNDGVDTFEDDNDFTAFHHVINELYPKQISKKVRQVKKKNAALGKFMGSQAPYGYRKSPLDKHLLVVDEEAAETVKRIYQSFLSGASGRSIASQFNREGIPSPREYHLQTLGQQSSLHGGWGSSAVMAILKNRVYAGDMVQGKREVISFKSKKRRQTSPDEWIVVENTHEPIIERDKWLAVQKMIEANHRQRQPKSGRPVANLTGVLFCADCGAAMSAALIGKKETLTYRCGRYVNYGREACASHSIRAELIENIILEDIRAYAAVASEDREGLKKKILSALASETEGTAGRLKSKAAEAEAKIVQIRFTVKNLYSEKVAGRMSEKMFYSMLSDYERELGEWEEKLALYREQLMEEDGREQNIARWVDVVEAALESDALDRATVMALIDRVTVSDKYEQDGQTRQDIDISYKFVGCLDGLLSVREKSIAQDRQVSGNAHP